jgi:hypothetical protein
MVRQYPHTISIQLDSADSTLDTSGNWMPAAAAAPLTYTCRAEPSNGNALVKVADGTQVVYQWMVYMPLPVESIYPGSNVVLTMDGQQVKGSVKRLSKGQLNARIWL